MLILQGDQETILLLLVLTQGASMPPTTLTPTVTTTSVYVCVFVWGSITSVIGVKHRSLKHISTEPTVYEVPQKETQLWRKRYGKPG